MLGLEKRRISQLLIVLLAILIVAGSLLYSNYLASTLMERERKAVALYGNALDIAAKIEDPEAEGVGMDLLFFIMTNLVTENNSLVPILVINDKGEAVEKLNLDVELADTAAVQSYLADFKALHDPIVVEYLPGVYNYVYYGEAFVVQQLRWFPLVQLLSLIHI